MTETKFHKNHISISDLDTFQVGRLSFAVQFRETDGLQGLTIHVFDSEGQHDEVLRFDCFTNEPHFHYGFSRLNLPFCPIPEKTVGGSFAWSCNELEKNLKTFLINSKADELFETIDQPSLSSALKQLMEVGKKLMTKHALV